MKFRKAKKGDLPQIVEMIANDTLGAKREKFLNPLPKEYFKAFRKIKNDKNQELIVIADENAVIIGTMQLTFIQYLTYKGGLRVQIEAVRIRQDKRSSGIGEKMIKWAIQRAKEKKAHLIQLTTDKNRPDAIKFYLKLDFVSSHEGMKYHL